MEAPDCVGDKGSSRGMLGLEVSLQDRAAAPSAPCSGAGGWVGEVQPGSLVHPS